VTIIDALTVSLLSVVCGAVAGAVVTELRDRWRDKRHKSQLRKGLLLAFKAQISKDLELLHSVLDDRSFLSPDDLSSCLYPMLWKDRQIEVYQYLPEIAPFFIEYFIPLTILVSQFSWEVSPRSFSASRWDQNDVHNQIDLGQKTLMAIEQILIKIPN